MILLPILRRIQRPTTQGHSSHEKYENNRKIVFISFHFFLLFTMPMIKHIDRVLLTSAERNAQDMYAARYPDRKQKSHMAFKRLADCFCRFGTVKQTRLKRRPIVNENNAPAILAFAALKPHASSRQMEKKSGIS